MQTEIKIYPKDFQQYNSSIISDYTKKIYYDVVEPIKGKKFFSLYSNARFWSLVWYEEDMWHCLNYVDNIPGFSISRDTIEEIKEFMEKEYLK